MSTVFAGVIISAQYLTELIVIPLCKKNINKLYIAETHHTLLGWNTSPLTKIRWIRNVTHDLTANWLSSYVSWALSARLHGSRQNSTLTGSRSTLSPGWLLSMGPLSFPLHSIPSISWPGSCPHFIRPEQHHPPLDIIARECRAPHTLPSNGIASNFVIKRTGIWLNDR